MKLLDLVWSIEFDVRPAVVIVYVTDVVGIPVGLSMRLLLLFISHSKSAINNQSLQVQIKEINEITSCRE